MSDDRRLRLHAGLVALTAAVFLMSAAGLHGWARELAALVVITFVPGLAVLSRLRNTGALMTAALAAALSLAIFALGAWLLVMLGLLKVWPLLAVVLAPSCWVLCAGIRKKMELIDESVGDDDGRRGARPRLTPRQAFSGFVSGNLGELAATIPVAAALLLWLLSLPAIDTAEMTDIGLPSVLPAGWWIAFALLAVGGGVYAASRHPSRVVIGLYVVALATVLFATLPLVEPVSHYPAGYKHAGVVRLLLEQGGVSPAVDIYNRWPGFFALAGVYTKFAGPAGPLPRIGWAELYFALLQTALVAAIAWRETRRAGAAGFAAIAFLLINWIGQGYYSPQAAVFTMSLAAIAVVLGQLEGSGNRIGLLIARIIGKVARSDPPEVRRRDGQWSTNAAVGVVLLLDAAIIVSHQLTPYALALQAGMLVICGFAVPRLLLVGLIGLPLLYLAPNLAWINDHFGVFTSLDPFSNARVNDPIRVTCDGCATVGNAATLSAAFAWAAALASVILLTRRRQGFRSASFAVLLLAPFLFLGGQNYGGEAPLRVVLFTSPISACLIAAAITTFKPLTRMAAAAGSTALLAACFALAYFGGESFSEVIPSDVRAVEHVYEHGRKGVVVMSAAPTIPDLLHPNYPQFSHLTAGGATVLFDDPGRQRGRLGPGDDSVRFVVDQMSVWGRAGYIIFSPTTDRFLAFNHIATRAESAEVQQAMLRSGRFRLWHQDGATKVYEFVR